MEYQWTGPASMRRLSVMVTLIALVAAACNGTTTETTQTESATTTTAEAATTTAPSVDTTVTPAPDGPWSFVDDRSIEVGLDENPVRIVAHEDAAVALLDFGIRPVGIFGSAPLAENPLFEGVDLTGIESLGEVWGEVNLEALAAVEPDLVVANFWGEEQLAFGLADTQLQDAIESIAPMVLLQATLPASQVISRMADLAGALGVDLDSDDVAAKRDAYLAAINDLRTTAGARPEISVLGVSTSPDLVYVANPARFPDLSEYAIQGVKMTAPAETDEFGYYLPLSWEEADRYLADVVLYDARAGHPSLDDLMAIPTFAATPAAQAGQLVPWFIPSAHSYSRNAAALQALNDAIQNAEDVVEEG